MPDPTDMPPTFGKRVRRARERAGLTRAIVGDRVVRSYEWVKAIESDRLQMPRLPLLMRLAGVLGVTDLAELTGDDRVTVSTYKSSAHPALPKVKAALTAYTLEPPADEPQTIERLTARLRLAWQLWHGAGDHRSRVADIVPGLLTDLQLASRVLVGADRRRALVALAETYHLAQLYLSFQPAPELVMLTGDRAMLAAQDADSPRAIAVASWYMNHVFRDAGEAHEARVDLAMRAAGLLRPDAGPEDLARWGLLQLAAALSHAKSGRAGDAWRYWDRADDAARRLGHQYCHPYLIFGQGMVDAYRVTMTTDLMQSASAVEVAGQVDLAQMPSATRRSFHMIESARAYSMQGEAIAVVHLLKKANDISPETARFNLFARSAVTDLVEGGPAMVRDDARGLARDLGVTV